MQLKDLFYGIHRLISSTDYDGNEQVYLRVGSEGNDEKLMPIKDMTFARAIYENRMAVVLDFTGYLNKAASHEED